MKLTKALKDPNKRDEAMQLLKSNVRVLEDEFGKQYEVVQIGEMNLPLAGFTRGHGRTFRDITTTAMRGDDVLLISFTKTGNCFLYHKIRFLDIHDFCANFIRI